MNKLDIKINKDEFKKKLNILDGKTPTEEELLSLIKPLIPNAIPGKDYILTLEDKTEIAKSIDVPVVEKIIEKTEVIKEQPIYNTTEVIKEVAKKITKEDIAKIAVEILPKIEYDKIKGAPTIAQIETRFAAGGLSRVTEDRVQEMIDENDQTHDTLQGVTDRGATTTNSLTAQSFIKTGGLSSEFLKADGSSDDNVYALDEVVKKLSGFENRTDSTISIDANGVFTIAPAVTSYNVWTSTTGKHTISTNKTVTVTDDQTITYIFIDDNGVLQKSTTAWDLALGNNIPVSIIFKDGTTYKLTDERHGYERNRPWHKWAHFNIGAMYYSGLTGVFTSSSLSVGQGIIYDEDIQFDTGATKTTTSLWYRNATDGMRVIAGSTTPFYAPAGVLKYDNGTGTLANVDNNKYSTQWVYATNDPAEPIYTVIGQNNDTLLADARNTTKPIINLSTAEWKLIYRVIIRNSAGTPTYIEAADFRTVQTGVAASGGTATDHSALTGRDAPNSHPISAISDDPTDSLTLNQVVEVTAGTITRDGSDNITSVAYDNRTVTINRDIDGIVTGWEDANYEWTLTRTAGLVTSWSVTAK